MGKTIFFSTKRRENVRGIKAFRCIVPSRPAAGRDGTGRYWSRIPRSSAVDRRMLFDDHRRRHCSRKNRVDRARVRNSRITVWRTPNHYFIARSFKRVQHRFSTCVRSFQSIKQIINNENLGLPPLIFWGHDKFLFLEYFQLTPTFDKRPSSSLPHGPIGSGHSVASG